MKLHEFCGLKRLLCVTLVAALLFTVVVESRTIARAAMPASISTPYVTIMVSAAGSYTIVSQTPS